MVSDFESYRRRHLRLKALEDVLSKAKSVMAVSGNQSDKIKAFYELQKAIEEADKLPPMDISYKKD